jgi:hypothetical protein
MTASLDLPVVSFVGQTQLLYPTNLTSGLTYSIIDLPPGGSWSAPNYSATGMRLLTPQTEGYHSVGFVGLSGAGGAATIVENVFSGQMLVLDGANASHLLSRYDSRIDIIQIDSDVSREASEQGWRAGIGSFAEFVDFVTARQETHGTITGLSNEASKALFFMQWVSGLWAYGNPTRLDLPGCVVNNEITGVTDPDDVTVRTYLDSPIGCCTDYTVMITMLLMAAGIENRIISGAGHVMNEAKIDGVWWTLDANLNIAYRSSFDGVIDTTREIDAIRFDHEGMRLGSAIYSDNLAGFYQTFLAQIEYGQFATPYRHDAYTYLSSLPYGNVLLSGLQALAWDGAESGYVGSEAARSGWTVGDFDGDGDADLMRAVSGTQGAVILTSNGVGLDAPATWSASADPGANDWHVGDFNGDGKSDIFAYRPAGVPVSGAFVHLSTGSAFTTGTSWTSATYGDWGWSTGDFDGDGKDDILRHVNGVSGAEVMLSFGAGFTAGTSWTGFGSGSQKWYVGDFNADGRDDLARFIIGGTQTSVLLSTGTSFAFAGVWSTQAQGSDARWHVGDFDGDGRSDLGRVVTGVGFEFMRSTGTGFAAPQLLTDALNFTSGSVGIGDFSGDGAADVMTAINRHNAGLASQITEMRDDNGFTIEELNTLVSFAPARLQIAEVDSPVSREAAAGHWRSATLDTFAELLAHVDLRRQMQTAAEHMTAFAAETARVLFYAQWFAGMVRPGDVTSGVVETVLQNSVVGSLRADQVSQNIFIGSAVGSASDVAALLAATLERLGSTSAVVVVGEGYIINEFQADEEWWSVNAQLGVAFKGRWHEVADGKSEPETYVFDLASMEQGSPTFAEDASQAQRNFIIATGAGLLTEYVRETSADWLASFSFGGLFAAFASLDGETGSDSRTISSSMRVSGLVGDYNGDGRDDFLSSIPGQTAAGVALSNAEGFGASSSWTTSGSGSQGWYVGDFNGDGRSDIFAVVSGVSGARMLLSDGTKFVSDGSWTTAGSGNQRWHVADFNGDGQDDLLRFVSGVSGAQVFLSTGDGFISNGSWTPAGQGTGQKWFIGDYNGDGRADLGRTVAGIGFQTLLSTGTGFAGPANWTAAGTSASGLRIADFNGDGLSDLVFLRAGASDNRVMLSTGSSFVASDWSLPTTGTSSWLTGDFDGNGADDVFDWAATSAAARLHLSGTSDESDILTGLAGIRDVFAVDANSGNDTIVDFSLSGGVQADQIEINPALAASLPALMALADQVGIDTVFTFGSGQTLTVKETLASSFNADHFIFI